jgi:secondary thiamine-phosphate synthase enzyme
MIALPIVTKQTKEVVDLTDRLEVAIQQNVLNEGLLVLFLPHTTAALTTTEFKPGMDQELLTAMQAALNQSKLMAAMIDPTLIIPVKDGRLVLGADQRVVLVEFDGPKDRQVSLSFVKSII